MQQQKRQHSSGDSSSFTLITLNHRANGAYRCRCQVLLSHFNNKDARKVHGLNTQSAFIPQTHVCVYSISCLVTHSTIFQSAALDSVLRSKKNAASCFDFFNRREWERSCLRGIVYFLAAAIRTTIYVAFYSD